MVRDNGPREGQGIECYLTSISVSGFIAAGWGHVRKGIMTSDFNPDIVIKSLYQVEWTFQISIPGNSKSNSLLNSVYD